MRRFLATIRFRILLSSTANSTTKKIRFSLTTDSMVIHHRGLHATGSMTIGDYVLLTAEMV